MKIRTVMFLSSVLLVPAVASAQSSDAKYCAVLSEKYDSFVDTSDIRGGRPTPANITRAQEKCQSDPASAIPVLEKALKDARFTLPPRN